jgi:hypothetical protein
MTDRYFANQRVRHSVTRRYYDAGSEVPVDHISTPALDALVARGVLQRVERKVAEPATTVNDEKTEERRSKARASAIEIEEVTIDD